MLRLKCHHRTLIASTLVVFATPLLSSAQTFEERGAQILGDIGIEFARSGSFADYDNDGDPDLFIQGSIYSQKMLRNNTIGSGSATFTNVTVEVGLEDLDQQGWSAAWGDYDADGDVDLFLGQQHSGNGDTRGDLFRNFQVEGETGFRNFGEQTGLDDPQWHENVAWVDIDQDGDLDLIVIMELAPHELYEQFAPGQFRPIAEETGFADPTSRGYGLAIGDYDGDRDLDVYISTCASWNDIPNTFFENQLTDTGVLGFIDVTARTGTQFRPNSYGSQFADFDDDGDLDLYMIGASGNPNKLWRNNGDGTFTDVEEMLGTPVLSTPSTYLHGGQAADYDNDGDLDLLFQDRAGSIGEGNEFLGEGDGLGRLLFRNDGAWQFTQVAVQEGLLTGDDGGFDSTFVDYDLDGDLDLFASTDAGLPQRFFVSNASTNGNQTLFVYLKGTEKNPSGIGAQLYATIYKGTSEERTLRRDTFLNVGTFHHDDLPVHFGLGTAESVDELRIVWPDGLTQVLTNVLAGQRLIVTIPGTS